MKVTKIAMALLVAGMGAGLVPAAHAADADRLAQLEKQLQMLQQEIESMKAENAKQVTDLRDQLTAQGKEAVVAGDIGNSSRIPGSETSVRVYGYAEANLIKDLKATAPGDTFTNLPEQPLDNLNSPEGKTGMTGQTSRFGFETSTPTAMGPLHTQVEGDFYAYCGSTCNRNRLRLRLAYGEYAGWMIGQNWSTFMDLDDGPETADFNGPIGMPFSRPVQIRYTYAMSNGTTFKAALENPTDGATRPNVVLAVSKSADWGGVNLRLLSHEQRLAYGSNLLSKSGNGIGVGGSYKLTGSLTFMGQYAVVDGDSDNTAMYGANYPETSTGAILMDRSAGYVIGLNNVFNEQWRATFALGAVQSQLGADDPYVVASTLGITQRMHQWHLNFFYTPIKNVDLGAELIGGTRTTYAGDDATLSRLNLLARYSFN